MRASILIAFLALGLVATNARGQGVSVATAEQFRSVEKRVSTLESQMRAVQRQVFPGGDPRFFAAEPGPPPAPAAEPPTAESAPELFELLQRVDRLEAQQRTLTGQVEELQFRLRTLEAAFERARADSEFRLDALEGRKPSAIPPAAAPAPAAPAPAKRSPESPAASAPADPEARYLAAYGLYTAKDFTRAATELEAFAKANPSHPRASNAQYWAGRSLMELGRHAEAAKLFLAGYQRWPKGQRAPESLLWLGKALTAMKQPKAACQALDQLRTAYPERVTGALAAESQRARAQAQCGA
ncbi:tol-pal system protein YbgF [Thermaurantiacus sp.]